MAGKRLPIPFDQKFGRWTILSDAGFRPATKRNQNVRLVNCRCDCGTERVVILYTLKNGDSVSCGCHRRDVMGNRYLRHGQSRENKHTKEYRAWSQMIHRCTDLNDPRNKRYSNRGINVCAGWMTSFESFFNDIGLAPSKKHSLDRIDNNAHYSCGHCIECAEKGWKLNCKWSTPKEQMQNRNNNRWFEYGGKRMIIADWARELNMHRGTLGHLLKSKNLETIIIKRGAHI